jgi:hypothetical protein
MLALTLTERAQSDEIRLASLCERKTAGVRVPPVTVIAYAVEVAVVLAWLLAARGPEPEWIFGSLVLVAATLGLWHRWWWAWLLLVVVAAGDTVVALLDWPAWWALAINGTMLALLLSPPTRRWAWSRRRPRP